MSDVIPRIEEVFKHVFDDDDLTISEATTASDIEGWDSLMHINLIVAIERAFDIKFAIAEIGRLKDDGSTVGDLLSIIEEKVGTP